MLERIYAPRHCIKHLPQHHLFWHWSRVRYAKVNVYTGKAALLIAIEDDIYRLIEIRRKRDLKEFTFQTRYAERLQPIWLPH